MKMLGLVKFDGDLNDLYKLAKEKGYDNVKNVKSGRTESPKKTTTTPTDKERVVASDKARVVASEEKRVVASDNQQVASDGERGASDEERALKDEERAPIDKPDNEVAPTIAHSPHDKLKPTARGKSAKKKIKKKKEVADRLRTRRSSGISVESFMEKCEREAREEIEGMASAPRSPPVPVAASPLPPAAPSSPKLSLPSSPSRSNSISVGSHVNVKFRLNKDAEPGVIVGVNANGNFTVDVNGSLREDVKREYISIQSQTHENEIDNDVAAKVKIKIKAACIGRNLEKIYKSADKDKSGSLDKAEWRSFCRRVLKILKTDVADKILDNLFDRLDINKNGTVEWEELAEFMANDDEHSLGFGTAAKITSKLMSMKKRATEKLDQRPNGRRRSTKQSPSTSVSPSNSLRSSPSKSPNRRRAASSPVASSPVASSPAASSLIASSPVTASEPAVSIRRDTLKMIQSKIKSACYGRSLSSLYKSADRDHNGVLDLNELQSMTRRVLKIPPHVLSDEDLSIWFDCIDEDKSGGVEWSEIEAFMVKDFKEVEPEVPAAVLEERRREENEKGKKEVAPLPQETPPEPTVDFDYGLRMKIRQKITAACYGRVLAKVFRSADKDNSGTIDRMEFQRFVKVALKVVNLSDEQVYALFYHLDRDNSGSIDLNEIRAFMRKDAGAPAAAPSPHGSPGRSSEMRDVVSPKQTVRRRPSSLSILKEDEASDTLSREDDLSGVVPPPPPLDEEVIRKKRQTSISGLVTMPGADLKPGSPRRSISFKK